MQFKSVQKTHWTQRVQECHPVHKVVISSTIQPIPAGSHMWSNPPHPSHKVQLIPDSLCSSSQPTGPVQFKNPIKPMRLSLVQQSSPSQLVCIRAAIPYKPQSSTNPRFPLQFKSTHWTSRVQESHPTHEVVVSSTIQPIPAGSHSCSNPIQATKCN